MLIVVVAIHFVLFFNKYNKPIAITCTDCVRFKLVWLSTWLSLVNRIDYFAVAKASLLFGIYNLFDIGNIRTSKWESNWWTLASDKIQCIFWSSFLALQIIMFVLLAVQKPLSAPVNTRVLNGSDLLETTPTGPRAHQIRPRTNSNIGKVHSCRGGSDEFKWSNWIKPLDFNVFIMVLEIDFDRDMLKN